MAKPQCLLPSNASAFSESPLASNQNQTFGYLEQKVAEVLGVGSLNTSVLKALGLASPAGEFNKLAEFVSDVNDAPRVELVVYGDDTTEIRQRHYLHGVSVLEQFDRALEIFRQQYHLEKIHGQVRESIEQIPEVAFKEALDNAFVCCAWDAGANVRVDMFADHVLISSPGGLTERASEENFLKGWLPASRNPNLGMLFYRLGLMEGLSIGIHHISESYRLRGARPEVEFAQNTITVKLPVIPAPVPLSSGAAEVLRLLRDTATSVARKDVEQAVGIGKARAVRVLGELCEAGYVRSIGKGPATRYEVH